MGMTYQRGAVWWVKYYRNGRPIRESSGSSKESDAISLLRNPRGRHRARAAGEPEPESHSVRRGGRGFEDRVRRQRTAVGPTNSSGGFDCTCFRTPAAGVSR
jgi:hypothetical protein